MAKSIVSSWLIYCVVGLLYPFSNLIAQPKKPIENIPVLQSTTELRKKLIALELSFVGVKELTGNNDGKEVEMFQRAVGLKKGDSWCAAGQSYCHMQLNIPNPESGWSPAWFNSSVVYEKGKDRESPFVYRGGEVLGYWIPAKGRIGHVAMAVKQDGNDVYTVHFNYMNRVMKVAQSYSDITIAADYVGFQELKQAIKNQR